MSEDRLSVAALRRAFDTSFAELPAVAVRAAERLLSVEIDGTSYAVPLSEITGMAPCGRITPLPTSTRALVGLAGIDGRPTPVFDLGELLGHPRTAFAPAWVILARRPHACAFGVPRGCAVIEIRAEHFSPVSGRTHVARLALVERKTWSIVAVASIMESLQRVLPAGGLPRGGAV